MLVSLVDKLIDRVIQLITHKQQMRKTMLDTYVTPVYSEFEHVHEAYLESFSKYRDLIKNTVDPNWIISLQQILERDNLFSANFRTKVCRLADVEKNDLVAPFVNGIYEYVIGARLLEPVAKEIYPPSLYVQRWRQSLIRTLGEILNENWQMVIEPDGARPPLSEEEIGAEHNRMILKYSIGNADPARQDKLKRAYAQDALDSIVMEMQRQYDQVLQEYTRLRTQLSK